MRSVQLGAESERSTSSPCSAKSRGAAEWTPKGTGLHAAYCAVVSPLFERCSKRLPVVSSRSPMSGRVSPGTSPYVPTCLPLILVTPQGGSYNPAGTVLRGNLLGRCCGATFAAAAGGLARGRGVQPCGVAWTRDSWGLGLPCPGHAPVGHSGAATSAGSFPSGQLDAFLAQRDPVRFTSGVAQPALDRRNRAQAWIPASACVSTDLTCLVASASAPNS